MIVFQIGVEKKLSLVNHEEGMREIGDVLSFSAWPDFRPNVTPREIFLEGSFGGSYWRPIFSSVVSEDLSDQHLEFGEWWYGIEESLLTSEEYDKNRNRYKVKCGTTLDMWEEKGWIVEQDPYGLSLIHISEPTRPY